MEVILLEKVQNLGNLGEKVRVKPGYARNFLIPKGKAAQATAAFFGFGTHVVAHQYQHKRP